MSYNQNQLELFQEHLNTKNSISLYEGVKNIAAYEHEKTLRSLIKRLTTPIPSETKDTVLIGPYKLGIEAKRANRNVVHVTALTFDIDHANGKSFEDIVNLTSKYMGILHTTWSHTKDQSRYRLILNLTDPIQASEFEMVRDGFLLCNPELEEIVDPACSEVSRAYYLFSYPPERADIAQCCVLMGAPINPIQYKLQKNRDPLEPQLTMGASRHQELAKGGIKEGGRNSALASLIGGLILKEESKEQSLQSAIAWNQQLYPPLDLDEVIKTHENIWKTHLRNHPESINSNFAVQAQEKHFTLIPASDLLASQPPKREWVIQEFLPNRIVGSIIAAGGTGKSFLAMHIAVSVASGSSLFGKYLPTEPRNVVFISGEDDSSELQRRLHKATAGLPLSPRQNIDKNLHFIDLADSFELFTNKNNKGEVSITDVPTLICSKIKEVIGNEVGLVIIDPISRFRGGEENLASDTTRFVQALQQIRDQLNTCVLTLHHVNKNAGGNGFTQNNARGSSAFIDGVRLVYQLTPLSDTELKQYGDTSSLPKLLMLQSVKSNYGKPIDPLVLARRDDGSLEIFNAVAGDHLRRALLQEIKLSKLSKTKFKETYGDAKGKFGLSEKAMVRKLEEFEIAKLIKIPSRGAMELTEAGENILSLQGNGQ